MAFTLNIHFLGVAVFFPAGTFETVAVIPNGLQSEPGIEPHHPKLWVDQGDVDSDSDPIGTYDALSVQHLKVTDQGAALSATNGTSHCSGLAAYPSLRALDGFPTPSQLKTGVISATAISSSVGARIRLPGGSLVANPNYVMEDAWRFELENGLDPRECKRYPILVTWTRGIENRAFIHVSETGSATAEAKVLRLRPGSGTVVDVLLTNFEDQEPVGDTAHDFKLAYRLFSTTQTNRWLLRRCVTTALAGEDGPGKLVEQVAKPEDAPCGAQESPQSQIKSPQTLELLEEFIMSSLRMPCVGGQFCTTT